MGKRTSLRNRVVSVVMSIVMAVGLMPLPAYAETGLAAGASALAAGDAGGGGGDSSGGAIAPLSQQTALAEDTDITVTIGDDSKTGTTVPWTANYYDTFAAMLYTPEEVGSAGEIHELAFKFNSTTAIATNYVRIYLGTTDLTSLATSGTGNNSRIPSANSLTLVYDGSPTLGTVADWQTFEFDTNYQYDKSGNLIVIVITDATYEASSVPKCFVTDTTDYMTAYLRSDTHDGYSIANPPESSWYGTKSRPDIKLGIETCSHEGATFNSTVAATCNEQGYDVYDCPLCGKEVKTNFTEPLGHAWDDGQRSNKDGSLSETGKYMLYTCTRDSNHTKLEPADVTVWDGVAAEQWTVDDDHDGTEAKPYEIATAANLAYLAKSVNTDHNTYSGKYFKQTADLDLADEAWTPIGNNSSYKFAGTYDGGNHSIEGLNVSASGSVGLFGYVGGTTSVRAKVANIFSVSGTVANTGSGSSNYSGGIVGYMTYADIENCANDATIAGGTSQLAGGIAGYSYAAGKITGCANRGAVTAEYTSGGYAGGILGQNYSNSEITIERCYNTGTVKGSYYGAGIVANLTGSNSTYTRTVKNCYNVGECICSGSSTYTSRSSGIVGNLNGSAYSNYANYNKISDCYSLSGKAVNDIVGYTPSGNYSTYTATNASGKTSEEMSGSEFVSLMNADVSADVTFVQGETYPILSWEVPAGAPSITASAVADASYKTTDTPVALSVTVSSESDAYATWYKATKADLSDAAVVAAEAKVSGGTASYTPPVTELGDSYYFCKVRNDTTNRAGTEYYYVQSPVANIVVWSGVAAVAPSITAQPQGIDAISQNATEGNVLSVVAAFAGEGETAQNCQLTYQWQRYDADESKWVDIDGATATDYSAPTDAIGTVKYRCIVTNTREKQADTSKSTTSDEANVTVEPMKVGTAAELAALRDAVNNGNAFEGSTIMLTDDIDLTVASEGYTPEASWTPIGVYAGTASSQKPFKGTFDGGGHTIKVKIDTSSTYQALFGFISNAAISNLVVDGSVKSTTNYLAAVAAYATSSTLTNVGNLANVETSSTSQQTSTPYTSVTGANMGGLVAYVSGSTVGGGSYVTFDSCYNKGAIRTTGASGGSGVGGIVGFGSYAKLTDCYNAGAVSNAVSGSYYACIGGLVGASISGSSLTRCYNAGTVSSGGATNYLGSLAGGAPSSTNLTNSGCYYLSGTASKAFNSGDGNATSITEFDADVMSALNQGGSASTWKDGKSLRLPDGSSQTTPALAWEVKGMPENVSVAANPESARVQVGSPLTLTATAALPSSGLGADGTLSYKWYVQSGDTPDPQTADNPQGADAEATAEGNATPTLTVPTAEAGATTYYCVITNTYPDGTGVAMTDSVTANVYDAEAAVPTVTVAAPRPELKQYVVAEGDKLTASASYTEDAGHKKGTEAYQWYTCDEDGGNPVAIEGATDATFAPNTDAIDSTGKYYTCGVTNTYLGNSADEVKGAPVKVTVGELVIETGDELKLFAESVNRGTSAKSANVKAAEGAVIDLNDVCGKALGENGEAVSWVPIGISSSYPFSGSFDGQGATIKGLYLNLGKTYTAQGLFGYVTGGVTIKNLTLEGEIDTDAQCVGSLVGQTATSGTLTLENVRNRASIRSVNTGTTTLASIGVGGLVGKVGAAATLTNCVNKGGISTTSTVVGGLVGSAGTTNPGTSATSCYNLGDIEATATGTSASVSGLLGYYNSTSSNTALSNIKVDNCYNMGKFTNANWAGTSYSIMRFGTYSSASYYLSDGYTAAHASATSDTNAIAKTAAELKDSTFLATLGASYKAGAAVPENGGFPALAWEVPAGAPGIVASSAAEKVVKGSSTTLTATATTPDKDEEGYDGTLSVTWYANTTGVADPENDTEVPGATGTPAPGDAHNTLESSVSVTPAGEPGDVVYYYCVATNSYGEGKASSTTSVLLPITVLSEKAAEDPVVALADESKSVSANEDAKVTLSATATLPGAADKQQGMLTYQWYSNTTNGTEGATAVNGASGTAASGEAFTCEVTATLGAKYYFCVVTNTAPDSQTAQATSEIATVTGKGTEIATAEDLYNMMQLVNAGTNKYAGKTVELVADIDLQDYDSSKTWTAIGTSTNSFQGTFKGNGHSISGLKIDSTADYQGLFGNVYNATIGNLLVSGDVKSTGQYVGGVVGKGTGTTKISQVGYAGTVTGGTKASVGGVVGELGSANCSISQCFNAASVTSSGSEVGGVIGYLNASSIPVTSCYNAGAVYSSKSDDTGGIYGRGTTPLLKNCYNYGAVSHASAETSSIGAIGGYGGLHVSSVGNYYLSGSAPQALGSSSSYGEAPISVTADQLSGAAVYPENAETYLLADFLNSGDFTGTWKAGKLCGHEAYPALGWEKSYTYSAISFVLNGGAWVEDFTAPAEYAETTALDLPTGDDLELRADSYFGGWYDNEQLAGEPVVAIDAAATGDKTFYAKWIDKIDIAGAVVTLERASVAYDGEPHTSQVASVAVGDAVLGIDDYEVVEATGADAGDYAVTVTGKGAYKGTATATFTIAKAASAFAAAAKKASFTFDYGTAERTIAAAELYEMSGALGDVSFEKKSGDSGIAVDETGAVKVADDLVVGDYPVVVAVADSGDANHESATIDVSFTVSIAALSVSGVEFTVETAQYTGTKVKPRVTAEGLTEGTDFLVVYSNNVAIGDDAKATVVGKGNYTGKKDVTFSIVAASIAACSIAPIAAQAYTGQDIEPAVTVTNAAGVVLEPEVDYSLGYGNNVQVGIANVIVIGEGNYAGTLGGSFEIEAADLSAAGCTVDAIDAQKLVEGGAEPAVTVRDARGAAIASDQYDVSYFDNAAHGTATVIVMGKGNYQGVLTAEFQVYGGVSADLSDAQAYDIEVSDMPYTGKVVVPDVAITLSDGTELVAGDDFEVAPSGAAAPGEYEVAVTGLGDVTGETTVTFNIEGADLATYAMMAPLAQRVYTGAEIEPALTVMLKDGTRLAEGADYVVLYANNVDVGTATAVVAGVGGYSGTLSTTFDIAATTLAKAGVTVKVTDQKWTGKALTPALTVVNKYGVALTKGVDYLVTYSNNKEIGTAKATIVGWGNYSGTKTATFNVVKAASSIKLAAQTTTYTGKKIAYSGKVTKSGSTGAVTYAYYSDAKCTKAVTAANVKAAGTYYVKATLAGDAHHDPATSAAAKLTVSKAANPMTVAAAKSATVKYNKSKDQKIAIAKALTIKKNQGGLTYAKTAGNAKITVDSKTGQILVKAGLAKGAYKIKVKVTAAGNANYKSLAKTVETTVTVS